MTSQSPPSSSSLVAISELLSRGDSQPTTSKDLSMSIGECCRSLEAEALPDSNFSSFLVRVHDHIVVKDSAIRSVLLRAIRYGMKTPAACNSIIKHGIHLLVIVSLEKESDFSWERMQALKLMKKFLSISPEKFPIGFARSLVAISSEKNDNFRRVALETVRQIGSVNAKIASDAGAFRVLFDAVLDPSTSNLAESILMTMLHLLNNPATRSYVRPNLDLQCLLTPFTDLDSSRGDEFLQRLELAKRALVMMMRSWAGVVELTADSMGLPAVVQLLSDPKISAHVKEAVLDCITEIFEPVVNTLEFRKAHGSSHVVKQSAVPQNASSVPPTPQSRDRRSTITPVSTSKREVVRSRSNTESAAVHSISTADGMLPESLAHLRQNSISAIINDADDADTLSPLSSIRKAVRMESAALSPASDGGSSKHGGRGKRLSMWTRFTTHAELAEKISVDPIYNMLDNYAGIICSAFIHVRMFDHLCWLCANGEMYISARCRDMIVDLMGVVSKVCTERVCSDLLTLPCLIDDAASASSMQHPDKAYKASDLLMALSDAFSVNKSEVTFAGRSTSDDRMHSSSSSSVNGMPSARAPKRLSARTLESDLASRKALSAATGLSSIADELVQTSLVGGTDLSSKKGEMAHDLKAFINTAVDRNEFSRQMEMSRILGKEGKEPFRWDWSVVNELLDYSLRNGDRLGEALKTKFIKRISGFYRCSVEEKGYFANLEWEPSHIHFLECACNLYTILVESDAGINFLNADRRGMVFAEIVRDLEAVITSAAAMKAASQGVGYASYTFSGASKTSSLNVFRPSGCVHTMAREYFCLIGRLSHTAHGRQVLNACQTYDHLSRLGHYVSLDYLSRVALTALGFTDGGFMSKDLLQLYTTSGATSDNLRLYCHTLLRALLRSRSKEFCEWGMGLMVEQLIFPHVPRRSIIRCLEEAAQDREYLHELISKEPDAVGEDMSNLLVRFLALPDGFRYLNGLDWIVPQLALWKSRKCDEYAAQVELALAKCLNSTILQRQQSLAVTPIPVSARAFSRHPAAPSGLQYPDGGVDMEGFLRIPWNIEVKLSGPSVLPASESDFVKLDTFLDSSELGCPASNDMTSDALRLVKVRGIVMDAKGMPSGHAVLNDKTVLSTLLCGVCPVTKKGTVLLSSNLNPSNGSIAPASGESDIRATVAAQHHSIHRRRKSVATSKSSYATPDLLGMRASLNDLPVDGQSNVDVPMSLLSGHLQEWTTCKPSHRQKSRQIAIPGSEDRFAIEVPGEPVVFIFSRYPPNMKPSDRQSSRYNPNAPVAYLVEVHYVLRLQTGQSAFLPLPRHMYGELARTSQGLKLLASNSVIVDLLASIRNIKSSSSRIISDLWALGHIASTENGFKTVMMCDPNFVPWCIQTATECRTYSIRACAFTVLGLISRTEQGSHHLNACSWECAPIHYVAVAMPKDHSVLFRSVAPSQGGNTVLDPSLQATSPGVASSASTGGSHGRGFVERTASSFMGDGFDGTDGNIESKILQCIGKLPGQILYRDSYSSLMKFHENFPELFSSRPLYVEVHNVLSQYSYKLSLRRMITGLFTASAKKNN